MRINLWFVLASAVAGVLLSGLADAPRLQRPKPSAGKEPGVHADAQITERERPMRTPQQLPAAVEPALEPQAPPSAQPIASSAPAPQTPRISRRSYLDARIEQQPPDPLWEIDVRRGLTDALSSFQHARVLTANCSAELCRVEFTADDGQQNVETLIDAVTNFPEVEGERMVEIDDAMTPPVGIAYFSRRGSISLAPPEVLAAARERDSDRPE